MPHTRHPHASHIGAAIIYLGGLLPASSSDLPECVAGYHMCTPIRSCSRWGLPSQPVSRLLVRSYRTVASLPVHSLCRTQRFAIGGLHFCGTIPRIAPAGRYPAPCPVELGLSSRTAFQHRTGDCPAYFFRYWHCLLVYPTQTPIHKCE